MGCWWAAPPHHSSKDVHACCQGEAERSREVYLPRPSVRPASTKSRGRCTCCTTCGVLNLSEGNPGPLPWSILTKKVTWPAALWVPMDGRGHPRHPVFPENPLAEMRRHCHAGGGPMGGCCGCTTAQPLTRILIQVLRERLPTQWSPLRSQGGSPVSIGGCPHAGFKYWKTEPGSRGHPTPMLL